MIALAILIFILGIHKRYSYYVIVNLVMITILNQGLKFIIQRPRPSEHAMFEQLGYSFPSGHSMVSMAFYGFLIYVIYENIQNKWAKWGLCTGLSFLILLIGVSRIYLGVHYASDVIGGFCLSICYLTLYTKMLGRKIKQ